MWYNKELNNEIDGTEAFLSLFNTLDDFYVYFFKNIIFFNPATVKEQSIALLKKVDENDKLPVRFSMKTKDLFHIPTENNQRGFIKKRFANKKVAQDFAETNRLVHNNTGISVCIDKNGCYYPRNEIFLATNHKVSIGSKSDMVNYVISHVWGNTDNPLFFSSLWNIVLIPNHLAYILDKPDTNSHLISTVKILVRAACFQLYKPNKLMNKDLIEVDERFEKALIAFDKLIVQNKITINFLEPKQR